MEENKKEEIIEQNLVSLIEDEEKYYGASLVASIGLTVTIASMLGITSSCTSQCWHP